MKKNFFPVALMALAIGFNACSSDDVTVNANGGGFSPALEGGYVKMAINMPSQVSGRAGVKDNGDQVDFNDGLPGEFAVKNATLLLFTKTDGQTEDQAKFHSAYDLPISMTKEGVQITSTTKIVSKVDKDVPNGSATTKLYAYVVLNNNKLIQFEKKEGDSEVSPYLELPANPLVTTSSATSTKLTEAVTFGDFRKKVVYGENNFKAAGFLMDNAPLSDKAGGVASPTITTLVDITGKVHKSKAEAEADDAKEIFVERALAKVTLQEKTTDNTLKGDHIKLDGLGSSKDYTIEGWALDVTNKTSFLGRDYKTDWNGLTADGSTGCRFIGSSALREAGTPSQPVAGSAFYRTYWGQDPNYDATSAAIADDFTYLTKQVKNSTGTLVNNEGGNIANKLGDDNPLYCMENTSDVAHMTTAQLTRVIVKVKFFNGASFFTFNGDNTTLYSNANMEARVKQAILDNAEILAKLKTDYSGTTIGANNIKLNWGPRNEDGKIILQSFKVNKVAGIDGADDKTYTVSVDASNNPLYDNLNKELGLGDILEYKDGIAYYPIRIKHFGDQLTPWDKNTANINDPYDSNNPAKYLGRYGVLRNNWYQLSISKISNIGSAVVPEIKFDEDNKPDEIEQYIAVRINVLSWAKRTQVEEL